jgi:hypothetical protein
MPKKYERNLDVFNAIFDKHKQGFSVRTLSKEFKIPARQISSFLKENGVLPTNRKYTLNQNAFAEITPQSAYWVGFLMADGNVYKDHISIGLSSIDKNHLLKFTSFLETDMPIKTELRKITTPNGKSGIYSLSRVSITSRLIANHLASYGVTERKSHTAKAVGLEKNLAFWRGVIDGDGCITLARNIAYINLVGSKTIVKQFLDFVLTFGTTKTTVKKIHKNSIYSVSVSGNLAKKLIETLYKDATTFLDRKYEKAMQIIEFYLERENGRQKSRNLTVEVIKLYNQGLSALKIQEILPLKKSEIYRRLEIEGIERRFAPTGLTSSQKYRLAGKCKDCGRDTALTSKSRCEYHLQMNRDWWRRNKQ